MNNVSSNEQCILATIPQWPTYQYMPRVSVNNDFNYVDVELFIDDLADVNSYRIEQAFNPVGPFTQVGMVPKPLGTQEIFTTHSTSLYNQGSLYYRTVAIDSCGVDAFVSDTIQTIFLQASSAGDLQTQLSWNEYVGWPTGVRQYDVWRSIDGKPGVLIHSLTPLGPGPYTFIDDLNASVGPGDEGGSFCYVIDASENPGNPYGFTMKASYSNLACAEQNPRIYVPNSFSPNQDGLNEVFKPSIVFGSANQYELFIYDRWGKNLFYSNNIDEGWDGTYEGKLVEQDTYVYFFKFIDLNGEEQEYRGTLSLFR